MASQVSYNDYLVKGWNRMQGVCDRCGGHDWRAGGDTNHCDDCQVGLVWTNKFHLNDRGTKMLCTKCLADDIAVDPSLLMQTRKYSHFGE